MANNDELVEQFVDITKDTEDRARFFLEANNWTLEVYNLYRFGFFRFRQWEKCNFIASILTHVCPIYSWL